MPRLFALAALLLAAGCMTTQSMGSDPARLASLSDADWTTTAQDFRNEPVDRVRLVCPANPSATGIGTVWGAEVYTDDSSICGAAVHAGKLTMARGGSVTIELRPGQSSYRGTDWNGIVSQPYGAWDGSFVVL